MIRWWASEVNGFLWEIAAFLEAKQKVGEVVWCFPDRQTASQAARVMLLGAWVPGQGARAGRRLPAVYGGAYVRCYPRLIK